MLKPPLGCRAASEKCIYRSAEPRGYIFRPVQAPTRVRNRTTAASKAPPATPPDADSPASRMLSSQTSINQVNTPPDASSGGAPPLRIPFFRWFGPTGIAPGFKRIFVQIKDGSGDQQLQGKTSFTKSLRPRPALRELQPSTRNDPDGYLFDPDDNLTPSSDILFPLLETFFEYYECHFPFYSKDAFVAQVKEKKAPALLLNSMCAMAARFSSLPVFEGKPAYVRGEGFANKAKHLLVPLLNLPSYDVVASILMIAWMEMATCHDVGIWMYTGMAVRMAEDMGMHKVRGPQLRIAITDHKQRKAP